MAFEQDLRSRTFPAAADYHDKQYYFVVGDTAGRAVLATADAQCSGVLQNAPAAIDRDAVVGYAGISKCVASAAIAIGDKIAVATGGKAKTATTGNKVVGRAETAAAADGEIFSIFLEVQGEPNA